MKPHLAALALAGLCLLATVPPADALVHGVRWTSTGYAVNGSQVAAISVHFSGNNVFLCGQPSYTVSLTSLAGAPIEGRTFAGFESQTQAAGQNYIQESFTLSGASQDPSVAFDYTGYEIATVNYAVVHSLNQVIVGHYQGWTFVASTLGYIFDFNC